MSTLARWERYAPVSLGLESMFSRLDALTDSAATNYPPYNIVKLEGDTIALEIALAGVARERIEVATEKGVLSVNLKPAEETDGREYLHKGLAARTFVRNWQLADDAVVDGVTYDNGLLTIKVRKEVPEAQQRKVLDIA